MSSKPKIRSVCAWCTQPMDGLPITAQELADGNIAHGICTRCAAGVATAAGVTLDESQTEVVA